MKDKVKINDFQELYKFFLSAKQGKTVFYISFGDPSDQAVVDFQVCEVRYRPQATTKANSRYFNHVVFFLGHENLAVG